jgi:hypothetical protein
MVGDQNAVPGARTTDVQETDCQSASKFDPRSVAQSTCRVSRYPGYSSNRGRAAPKLRPFPRDQSGRIHPIHARRTRLLGRLRLLLVVNCANPPSELRQRQRQTIFVASRSGSAVVTLLLLIG